MGIGKLGIIHTYLPRHPIHLLHKQPQIQLHILLIIRQIYTFDFLLHSTQYHTFNDPLLPLLLKIQHRPHILRQHIRRIIPTRQHQPKQQIIHTHPLVRL
jgi:hypothetical protein